MSSDNMQAVPEAAKVLLVSPYEEDHLSLRTILRHSNWQPESARTHAEAMEYLRKNTTPVVICESHGLEGSWKELLAHFTRMQRPPLLVVTSLFADERLWSEALNLGAYNVLAKPFSTNEVLHVIGFAAQAWERAAMPRALARTA